jgi:hypothetical protein
MSQDKPLVYRYMVDFMYVVTMAWISRTVNLGKERIREINIDHGISGSAKFGQR